MATIAIGGALIGLDLAIKALVGLGIAVIGGLILGNIKKAIEDNQEKVRNYLQNLSISKELSYHVLRDDHNFTDECKELCIMEVAYKVKERIGWTNNGNVPYIRGDDYCYHNCNIEVRMSIPPGKQEWVIGTAFHTGICNLLKK